MVKDEQKHFAGVIVWVFLAPKCSPIQWICLSPLKLIFEYLHRIVYQLNIFSVGLCFRCFCFHSCITDSNDKLLIWVSFSFLINSFILVCPFLYLISYMYFVNLILGENKEYWVRGRCELVLSTRHVKLSGGQWLVENVN